MISGDVSEKGDFRRSVPKKKRAISGESIVSEVRAVRRFDRPRVHLRGICCRQDPRLAELDCFLCLRATDARR